MRILRGDHRTVTAMAVTTTLLGTLVAPITLGTAQSASASTPTPSSAVDVWQTTTANNQIAQGLSYAGTAPITATSPAQTTVVVDPTKTYQTVSGFGAALTDSSATLIAGSPQRDQIMNSLFGASGARLSYVRIPMGASDFSAHGVYSYDDNNDTADPNFTHFSVAHDTAAIIPLLQQARSINPAVQLMAAPWSAPAWMKDDNSLYGNCNLPYLRSQYAGANITGYANYFVKFAKEYQNTYHLPISLLSMQNEPQNCTGAYPSMEMTPQEQATLAVALRNKLNLAGLGKVDLLGYDHNWDDRNGTKTTYPATELGQSTAAEAAISVIGFHCYSGASDVGLQTEIYNQFNKDSFMSECTSGVNNTDNAGNLVWEAQNLLIQPLRNYAIGSLYWNVALRSDGSPNLGTGVCAGNPCEGMITIDGNGNPVYNEHYYLWGQFSRFVDPGAQRIYSTDFGAGNLQTVAFKDNGNIVLVALNPATGTRQFTAQTNGSQFTWTMQPRSVATFVWTPGPSTKPNYNGHIVQWDGDTKAQKTAWLVKNGKRYWIPDAYSYYCFKDQGAPGPDVLPSYTLDSLPDQTGQQAQCIRPASTYEGHIVQWDGDTKAQKTAWLVRNGKRYWIPDAYSYYCWQSQGAPGPDVLPSYELDSMPDQTGQQAQCIRPASTYEGHIVQWDGDTNAQKTAWLVRGGKRYWIPDSFSYYCFKNQGAPGPDVLPSYVLDSLPDQTGQQAQCVPPASTYESHIVQWDGDTKAQKTAWLVRGGRRYWIPDTRTYGCLQSQGSPGPDVLPSYVLNSLPDTGQQATCYPAPGNYLGHIVQWDGDTKAQKTAWYVTPDGRREWIPDSGTYYCLKNAGVPGPDVLPSQTLDQLPDQNNQWVPCGDTMAVNRVLRRNMALHSSDGRYTFVLQGDGNLVLYGPSGRALWATNRYTTDFVVMQSDGNFVCYTNGGSAVWASSTNGSGGDHFVVQSDGNLVIYTAGGHAVWASNTAGRT